MATSAPYRGSAGTCQACHRAVSAPELSRYAGLDLCEGCLSGDLAGALHYWWLELEPGLKGGLGTSREVRWHGRVELEVSFSREGFSKRLRKLLGAGSDRDLGFAAFDDATWIDGDVARAARVLLAREGARQAVADVLRRSALVSLRPEGVFASGGTAAPALPLVALGIHVTELFLRLTPPSRETLAEEDPDVPLGRKVCFRCRNVTFERRPRCPLCDAELWWVS